MTVGELIEYLRELPSDTEVYMQPYGYEVTLFPVCDVDEFELKDGTVCGIIGESNA